MSAVFLTNCSLFGYRSEEEPNYSVIIKDKKNEIRLYKPYLIAKTTVEGSFKEAQSKGFKILANFIFGDNKSKSKIAMTAPVTLNSDLSSSESKSEKIAMTAPVVMNAEMQRSDSKKESWTMTFTMPSSFNVDTLPVPNDNRILIEEVPSKFMAALRFTGFWNTSKVDEKGKKLLEWINKQGQYQAVSKPMFAGYNPPWTLPFFRRNEVWIEVKSLK